MSFRRAQNRTVNRNTYLDNRLTTFTNPPIYTGDLYVERDETVGGNLTVGKNLRADSFYATGNYYLDTFALIPAGTIIMSACVSEPGGWLDCNGRLLSISLYSDLFSAINDSFGGADNSFNIPDMRGRVGVGFGQGSGLTNRALAAVSGAETHTLTIAEMSSHDHSLTRRANPDAGAYDTGDTHQDESSASTTDRDNLGTFNTNSRGSSNAHNNMQPFVVIRYLIKY